MKKTLSISQSDPIACLMPGIVYSQGTNYFGRVPRALEMHLMRPDAWSEGKNIWESGKKEKLPTVVWVIGGAWQQTAPLRFASEFSFLAKAGYNVAMIDYRVTNEACYPIQIQDVKTAIRFLRAHADQYGIEENRIAVMGDSSGGYLASMVGTTGGIEKYEGEEWAGYDSSVQAVIDEYGPVNLKEMHARWKNVFKTQMTPFIQFMGEEGIEDEKLLEEANPVNHIKETTPPFLILHGTKDELVPAKESEALYEALQKKQVPSDLYILEGAQHAGFEFWQPEIKEIILKFLNTYL